MAMELNNLFKKAQMAFIGLGYPIIQYQRDKVWKGAYEAACCLSFDVDYKKDEDALPYLTKILRKYDVLASFACVGAHVEKRPEPYKALLAEGHELVNHSYTHPHNKELSPDIRWSDLSIYEKTLEIKKAQDVFEEKTGFRPAGFRLPHFGNIQKETGHDYYDLLAECGISYSSSVLDFQLKGETWVRIESNGIIEIGITTCPFHPYTAMDSYHILRSRRLIYRLIHSKHNIKQSLIKSFDLCQRRRLLTNVYLDPLDMDALILEPILREALSRGIHFLRYKDFIQTIEK